ncbi:MAG: rod shape-determining protein RodA [Clostridiales bacterium]|nr:rod shape-determining protein RodA [Clostridiales bacterium]
MSLYDKKDFRSIDWFTVALVFVLVGFGIVALTSVLATPFDGTEQGISDVLAKLNLDYVQRQAINFLVGLAAMIIVMLFDYNIFKPLILYVYIGIVGLLAMLFVFGKVRGGAQGWFIFDSIERAIQPGELSKVAVIVMVSKIASKAMDADGRILKLKDIFLCVLFTMIPFLLIALQPDYGTAFVLIVILAFILFAARIKWYWIAGAAAALGTALPLAYFFLFTSSQQKRIISFLDPSYDPLGAGYQVATSKVVIGSGRLLGKGFFSTGTLAQLKYVPERHTDFIYSGIVEGIGFVGGTVLIVLFFLLALRWLYIAVKARDNFGMLLAVGVTGMLIAHVFENIGMTIGLMPMTGIPLPFVSYGGSNMLTNMIGVGIVLNVYMRHPVKKKRRRDKAQVKDEVLLG